MSFEAMYKLKIPKLVNNIIFPKYNVATIEKNACVIEGVRYVPVVFSRQYRVVLKCHFVSVVLAIPC